MSNSASDDFEDFCTILGLMTLTWAYIDNGLAIMLGTIIDNAGSIKGHTAVPLSFRPRVACFRNALRDAPALQSLQQDGRALAMRLTELGRRRNKFVHRSAIHHDEGGFEAIAVAVDGRNYTVENSRFEVRDAARLQGEIAELCGDVLDFMARVDAAFAQ